jgi:hypothetical protein
MVFRATSGGVMSQDKELIEQVSDILFEVDMDFRVSIAKKIIKLVRDSLLSDLDTIWSDELLCGEIIVSKSDVVNLVSPPTNKGGE